MKLKLDTYYRNGYGDIDHIKKTVTKDGRTLFYGDFVYTEDGKFLGHETSKRAGLRDEIEVYYFQIDYESGAEYMTGIFAKDEKEAVEKLKNSLVDEPITRIQTSM